MLHNRQKKIAVINDFCGFGRCSIAVSLPIISALKVQCCPIPTSVFSNHTGYDTFYCTDYTQHMDKYIDEWVKLNLHFEGIITGFLGTPEQVKIVKRFFELFKKDDSIIIVDPVMGDGGKLYSTYSPVLAKQMLSLIPYADIITPNLTEACILTDIEYKSDMNEAELFDICVKLSSVGPEKIVISGLDRGEYLENFVYESGKEPHIIRTDKIGECRAGTGDVFSSVIAADVVNGVEFSDAVNHAVLFINKALQRTVELNLPETDGICFEEYLTEIGKEYYEKQ